MTENRSVLVVDDDAAMREMLISLLEESGFEPVSAASADLALQEAKGSDFAVVLSDIRMPGQDSFELLGQLRELRPDTPACAFGPSSCRWTSPTPHSVRSGRRSSSC